MIEAVPVAIPDKRPEDRLIVAMPVLLLVHVPPVVVLLSVHELPIHIVIAPDMAAGTGLTVTVLVMEQPVDNTV